MTNMSTDAALRCTARVLKNSRVSSGLIRLDLELDQEQNFEPGQFAMINLPGSAAFVFSRPFSILDVQGRVLSLLYRVVGRGTEALKQAVEGDFLTFLGPLGRAFDAPVDKTPVVLIGGGVGLPPVWAWHKKHSRPGDMGFFGARDGADVPWDLLDENWRVSVDRHEYVPERRVAWQGLVPGLVAREIPAEDTTPRLVMACGPIPLLRAVAELADARGWQCLVSLEEHMGCGYGACKGCVVPVLDPTAGSDGWRNATCCQEGPVFRAESIQWSRYGKHDFGVVG